MSVAAAWLASRRIVAKCFVSGQTTVRGPKNRRRARRNTTSAGRHESTKRTPRISNNAFMIYSLLPSRYWTLVLPGGSQVFLVHAAASVMRKRPRAAPDGVARTARKTFGVDKAEPATDGFLNLLQSAFTLDDQVVRKPPNAFGEIARTTAGGGRELFTTRRGDAGKRAVSKDLLLRRQGDRALVSDELCSL